MPPRPEKRNQPRWKARFTNALAYLKKTGCVEDIGLHLDLRKELAATQKGESRDGHCWLYKLSEFTKRLDAGGNEIRPKALEPSDIPSELAGRPASSQLPEQGLPPVLRGIQGRSLIRP